MRNVTRKDGSTFERWEGKLIVGHNPDGSSKRRTVYGRSQAEALEKLEAIKKELLTRTYSGTSLTVEGFIQHWLDDRAREVGPQTVDDYRYELENYAVPKLGRIKLAELKPLHIQQLVKELTA